MRVASFAPHLAGRMLPGLFSQHVGKQERFPGDPWPYLPVLPQLHWMHATECLAGLYRAFPVPSGYLTDPRAPTLRGDAAPRPAHKPLVRRRAAGAPVAQRELFAGVRA